MIRQFCEKAWAGKLLVSILFLLISANPSRADEPEPLTRRKKGDLAIQARAILKKYCSDCHNDKPDRFGTIAVLDYSRLVANAPNPVPFVLPKNPSASQIIQFIEDGTMPPGNRPRPEIEEIAVLKQWIEESAPSYPAAFDELYTLKVMLDDIDRQPAQTVPYLRYISLAHLVTENGLPPNLGMVETKLKIGLRWCNLEMPKPPVEVDDTATLFRLDIRTMGWEARDLFFSAANGPPGDISPLKPYDLLLLEYPHGFRLPPGHPLEERLNRYFKITRQLLPIPFLRADWLGEKLAKDKPLADDLKSLTELRKALEKQGNPVLGKQENMPCGPTLRAFSGGKPEPVLIKPETGTPILPLGAWYSGNCRTEPAPFELEAEVVNKKLEPLKTMVKRTPFMLKVKSNRDVHFVLLMVWSDGTVVLKPTKNGRIITAGETALLTPKDGEEFKIDGILTGAEKAYEYFVLLASQSEIPTPIIVKSRHGDTQACTEKLNYPISRFFFEPETKIAGFDPSRVVRVVVPIEVTAK
jgi:hypothetical protein